MAALDDVRAAADARSAVTVLPTGGTATLHWSADLDETVLVSDGLPVLAAGRSFELWRVRDAAPVSAGAFNAAGGSAVVRLDGALAAGEVVAVTIEADGGSPTGAPTSSPILVLPAA